MKELLLQIYKVKQHNCHMFADPVCLSENLIRWQDDNNPLHYNRNHFLALGEISHNDIEIAIEYQKQRFLQGFILKTELPLSAELIEKYQLKEEKILLMTRLGEENSQWKINPHITIKDGQKEDISEDLLAVCAETAESDYHRKWIEKAIRECLSAAQTHPEYHWLTAYLDGKTVARCYVLDWAGFVQMEDLWVREEFRHQHIATTLLQYIRENFGERIFFHTEAADSAQDFYRKLGFETIAHCYEYRKEW